MKYLNLFLTFTLLTLLLGCSRNDGTHEYELNGVVAEVIKCHRETDICKAWVYKGPKEKYNEIWSIDGIVKKGDKVLKTCRFTIIELQGKDDAKSAGLSSRNKVEKTLDYTNCDELAQVN